MKRSWLLAFWPHEKKEAASRGCRESWEYRGSAGDFRGTVYPGLAMRDEGQRLHVIIPEQYRIGHEAQFAPLMKQFLECVKNPRSLPEWEKPNMLAKYYVTTEGIALARRSPADKAHP